MLKELETFMNDKADEVYIAMRRDYNSVLGGGDVPRNGEILPKTQRLVRKEIKRIIDSVEKAFSRIAGVEFKDEDDEEEEEERKVAHGSDDEDGGPVVGKKEEDADFNIKREASPSTQLDDQVGTRAGAFSDEALGATNSDGESETKQEIADDEEQEGGGARSEGGDSDGSESSAGSESD